MLDVIVLVKVDNNQKAIQMSVNAKLDNLCMKLHGVVSKNYHEVSE